MFIDRGMGLGVVQIHRGILYSPKKRSQVTLVMWMDLEPVIQREVSQKEKNNDDTLTRLHGI